MSSSPYSQALLSDALKLVNAGPEIFRKVGKGSLTRMPAAREARTKVWQHLRSHNLSCYEIAHLCDCSVSNIRRILCPK